MNLTEHFWEVEQYKLFFPLTLIQKYVHGISAVADDALCLFQMRGLGTKSGKDQGGQINRQNPD